MKTILDLVNNVNHTYEGNLRYYFALILKKATNLYNPYHNLRHLLHVTWMAYQGGEYHWMRCDPVRYRKLLVSAVLHDVNHLGRMDLPDAVNIAGALGFIERYLDPCDRSYQSEILTEVGLTENTYIERDPSKLTITQCILRDADASQTFSDAWLQQVLLGIVRERHLNSEMEAEILRQLAYLEQLTFFSGWGQSTLASQRDARIHELNGYLQILDSVTIHDAFEK